MTITKWDELQLRFDLELDEVEDDAVERRISAEEARLISEAARGKFAGKVERTLEIETGEDWFRDYLMLIEQGWPWRVACYMAWASSPKEYRWPATITELATHVLGLTSPRVIYTWRQKYASIDTVVAMMQAAPLWEHRRDVLEALAEMAKTQDYKAFNDRKLFLEMIGDYVPRSRLDVGKAGKGDLSEMTDEELRRWMGEDDGFGDPSRARKEESAEVSEDREEVGDAGE